MDDPNRLSSSLATLKAVEDADQLSLALQAICQRFGLSHMTFLVASIRGPSAAYPYFCTTYSQEWTQSYLRNWCFEFDPVVDILRWGHLPIDWASLDWRSAEAARLRRDARRNGIGPQGLTIPTRGPKGERGLLSVTSNRRKRDWSRLRMTSIHDLLILSHYLHETALTVTGLKGAGRYRELSKRETQCLELLATGLIAKQIAAALAISESAVKLYVRSARNKLGATTSHQAVAKASFFELIKL